MKKLIILAIGLAMACNSSQTTVSDGDKNAVNKSTNSPKTFAETITESELKDHLYTYASDEFEGRETGQPGQKKAVEYLKAQYEKMGIPAAQKNGDYFQKVPLQVSQLPVGSLTVDGKEYPLGESFLTFSKAQGTFSEIVYAGYGIEEGTYSDYKNLDVKDKVILIKSGEPVDANGNYLLSGSTEKSIWSNMSESLGKRLELASSKGAKGILYYDESNFSRFKSRFKWMETNDSGRMELAKDDSDGFFNFLINSTLAKAILPTIVSDHKPRKISKKISIDVESDNDEISSENVVAVLKGSEKPDEYVVISSHLDHIGITADGEINNGADDDGSGTVALLEIAQAFKKAADAGKGPKRSIVFLHVTGEEKGLLGSQYYTDVDPIFPLENTVANLNIDMIGRIDPKRDGERNYIYLIGSDKLSTDLHELSEEVNNKYTQIELDYTYNDENDPNRFYYRSDHYNFAKNNIPIIFYFNGTHDDYHRPGDTPDKINYDLLENRTRLVFYTAWEVANRDQRVVVDKASK
ncbi:M28 family peptidase [Zobellia galactanivorans]|uniref:M28 family peptidase n=1 Tax=Zobellia galactanivorans (strain DSM 12802 / CCUG 47099 / CIP 106680 / NCIMB 13871 / Dsij) TaxID=63186 RepID=UPI0026E1493A|nr:M28 family peptidase [Zobellia galactanivorans]MDO6807720.1 M28 family peptidase [Zobellia galactanivorans]